MADSKVVVCPYCGAAQTAGRRCGLCKADFGQLARRATLNQMGPWFVRDEAQPFKPGCSYESMVKMIDSGQVTRYSILRGPTTSQLWTVARKTPGIAHLLGDCHNCNAKIEEGVTRCSGCGTVFGAWLDRNHLGIPELRAMPGEPEDAPGTSEEDDRLMRGFRPLASEGLSAFVHIEETGMANTIREGGEDVPDPEDAGQDVVHSSNGDAPSPSSIFDQAVRAELGAARRHSSRMTILAVLAIVAAVATLLVAVLWRPDKTGSSELVTVPQSTKITSEPLPGVPAVGDDFKTGSDEASVEANVEQGG